MIKWFRENSFEIISSIVILAVILGATAFINKVFDRKAEVRAIRNSAEYIEYQEAAFDDCLDRAGGGQYNVSDCWYFSKKKADRRFGV